MTYGATAMNARFYQRCRGRGSRNTVDLPIRWNWHRVRPGVVDLNGSTNPRRDLRGLVEMVAAKKLH
jgi:hypothetical protein